MNKMAKSVFLRLLMVLPLLSTSSCYHFFDKEVDGIIVPEMIWYIADDDMGIDYCKILEKALDGDEKALQLLVYMDLADVYDGEYLFQNRTVLVQIIRKKGERFFIEKMDIDHCSPQDKAWLLDLINWGLDYELNGMMQGDAEVHTQNEFPLIYHELTSD